MWEADLVQLARGALMHAAVLSGPLLIVGMIVGVLTGVLQAITQVHDQSLSFSPKLFVVLIAFSLTLPWLMQRITDYAAHLFSTVPGGY